MDTIEQKEKDTIELRKLTRFQKKQVLLFVDRFLEENGRFPGMPKNAERPIPYLRRRGGQKEASRCTSAMNVEEGSLRI